MNVVRPAQKENPDRLYMQQGYLMVSVALVALFMFIIFNFNPFDHWYEAVFCKSTTLIIGLVSLWDGITIVREGKYDGAWLTFPSRRWFVSKDYRNILKYRLKIEEFFQKKLDEEILTAIPKCFLIERLNHFGVPLKDSVETSRMLEELRHCCDQSASSPNP